jgi:hypothetical protein
MKFKVEIEVDDDNKVVTIVDSRTPNEKKEFVGGLHLIATNGEAKNYYALTFGAAADIGWALAQFFNDGWKNPFVKRLFGHFTEWINKFMTNVGDGYEPEDVEKVLDKWEKEDKKNKITYN